MKNIQKYLFVYLLTSAFFIHAQNTNSFLDQYNTHFEQATNYSNLSLYVESATEFKKAIKVAENNNLEEQHIRAKIALAEIFRKTQDFDNAFEILKHIPKSDKYPALHVEKLGRIAAIYNEANFTTINKIDSVRHYLDLAMKIAVQYNMPALEASLNNELGYTITTTINPKQGRVYLLKAASIYQSLNDTINYVGVKINLLNNYSLDDKLEKVPDIRDELLHLVKDKKWYSEEIRLHRAISYYNYLLGDSLEQVKHDLKAERSTAKLMFNLNSAKMNTYRVLHETEKYQTEAKESQMLAQQKVKELKLETARTRELVIYLSLFVLLGIGFIILWVRERNLKKEVKIANDNYHMLIVESNHRIKNNLQMIISMLQYASKDLTDENSKAFKKISSKIYTISALHKHLYMDVHNERVSLDIFFNEIILSYRNIIAEEFIVKKQIGDIKIKSERIIYFGLILNEMLSNTFEHNKQEVKEIQIEIEKIEEGFEFSYCDSSEHVVSEEKGQGSILIKQLINRIEGSKFTLDTSTGKYTFQFDYE